MFLAFSRFAWILLSVKIMLETVHMRNCDYNFLTILYSPFIASCIDFSVFSKAFEESYSVYLHIRAISCFASSVLPYTFSVPSAISVLKIQSQWIIHCSMEPSMHHMHHLLSSMSLTYVELTFLCSISICRYKK